VLRYATLFLAGVPSLAGSEDASAKFVCRKVVGGVSKLAFHSGPSFPGNDLCPFKRNPRTGRIERDTTGHRIRDDLHTRDIVVLAPSNRLDPRSCGLVREADGERLFQPAFSRCSRNIGYVSETQPATLEGGKNLDVEYDCSLQPRAREQFKAAAQCERPGVATRPSGGGGTQDGGGTPGGFDARTKIIILGLPVGGNGGGCRRGGLNVTAGLGSGSKSISPDSTCAPYHPESLRLDKSLSVDRRSRAEEPG
jgi:hypothetical protein